MRVLTTNPEKDTIRPAIQVMVKPCTKAVCLQQRTPSESSLPAATQVGCVAKAPRLLHTPAALRRQALRGFGLGGSTEDFEGLMALRSLWSIDIETKEFATAAGNCAADPACCSCEGFVLKLQPIPKELEP